MRNLNILGQIFNKIRKDTIFVYAAHASFYIIISAVPFIMVLLGILEQILPLWDPEVFKALLPPVPSAILPLVTSIIEELFSKRNRAVFPISAASLLFTSSRGIAAVMRGVSRIYCGKQRGFFSMLFLSILYTILFLSLIIVIFFSVASAFFLSSEILNPHIEKAIAFFLISLIFFSVYSLFCAKKLPFKVHIPGAVIAAFSQGIFSAIYSFYIDTFGNYSSIYGSLTAVVLLFLWTYFSMVIFLFGAELNVILWEFSNKKISRNTVS